MRASRSIGTIEGVSVELRPDEVERLLALERKFAKEGLTFDDVLLVPDLSEVHPRETDVQSLFSRRIPINVPIAMYARNPL